MINLETQEFLILGALLFSVGIFVVLSSKNSIVVLMGLEIIFNSVNVNLMAVGNVNPDSQMFALFVIVLAACELAIALALVYKLYREYGTELVDKYKSLGEK